MDWLKVPLFKAAAIVVLTAASLAIVGLFKRRGLRLAQSWQHVSRSRRQQVVTLIHILHWSANAVIVLVAGLMVLGAFGVNITPLLASAGIVGLAFTLGAQSLLKDILNGVLILVEDQYAVGDTIRVGDVSGQVEQITLRATYIRTVDGDLYLVPNGEVRVVGNRTQDWSSVAIDLGVAYEEDLDRVLAVLEDSAAAFAQQPRFEPLLLEPPHVLGVTGLGDWAVSVRVRLKTQPGQQWQLGRELRKHLLAACAREGIDLPYPRQEVWLRSS